MMNVIKKIHKKSWKHIQNIKNASDMIAIEASINSALLDAFGLRHLGLMKIAMSEPSKHKLLLVYGCETYNDNFQLLKSIRYHNLDTYGEEAKKYLISLIPTRFHKSLMYQKLVA